MLVLSRRSGEKIVFPNLGITVEVLRVKGQVARLGIHAPKNIPILRHELVPLGSDEDLPVEDLQISATTTQTNDLPHALRNRLHAASLALHLFRRQHESGLIEEAEATFEKLLEEFEAVEIELVAGRRSEREPRSTKQSSRRALLVEDDANERDLLAGFLRISGYQVATATDGADALDYLSKHAMPDVVLLDMLMPRCDGPTTVRSIRGNPRLANARIFAVSGSSPASLGIATGHNGVNRWFSKPLNPERLVAEIDHEFSLPNVR